MERPTAVETPTPAGRPRPSDQQTAYGARLDALRSARNPGAQSSARGRPVIKLGQLDDRQRSRSRNYDIFLPKQSHIHTPKRGERCTNPDKITRSASPTRVLARSESGSQNYRTSLSAVSTTSRDELNSSSNTLDSSTDALSINSDSPFRKRNDFAYRSLPHGRSSDRFKSVDAKAGQILRDYHQAKDRTRLQLYDIQTGKYGLHGATNNQHSGDDLTPTPVNGHVDLPGQQHVTFDSVTTPSTTSSCGSPAASEKRQTPVIHVSDVNDVNGNHGVMENGAGPLQGGKPLITAEYYCVKRVNYGELKEKFANGTENTDTTGKTDDAVKKLNLMPVNGEKERKSLASSISNFFRKMSPRLNRKSRGSERSSQSSMGDDDSSSQGSPSHVAKAKSRSMKSPLSSPIRRLINGRKQSESESKNESKTESKNENHASENNGTALGEVKKKELEPSRSLPPRTLDVEGRLAAAPVKRGLLSTRSSDSIGDCSLDVNIAGGSDPSLQSCSVSKRTLHSTEPPKAAHADVLTQDALNQNIPSPDPHKYSYLGLSVSVGGYPKYRPFNKETKSESERPKSDHENDVLNANHVDTTTGASAEKADQTTGKVEKTTRFDQPEIEPSRPEGADNMNNSAGADDEVFTAVNGTSRTSKGDGLSRLVINGTTAAGEPHVGPVTPLSPDPPARTRELRRGSVAKGGQFYLARVAEETARIHHFVALAEADLAEPGRTEEVYGKLRASVGKANLLVSQKFKQFIGLCEDNLHPKPDQETHVTTNEDLAGFWDMMSLQVEDVDAAFAEIQKMRENNWVEVKTPPVYRSLSSSSQKEATPEKPKRTPKKTGAAASSRPRLSPAQNKSREEARKRLMEAKRLARRKRLTSGGSIDDVEIFIADPDNKAN